MDAVIVLIIMVFVLFLVVVPVLPVAAIEWSIVIVYGALTGFTRVSVPAAVVVTVLMIIGSTSQYWAPFIGLKGGQMSCLGLIAFFVGAMIGTVVIPFPVLGTLIGGIVAVILVEFLNTQDWRLALVGAKAALKTFIIGMAMELVFAILIVLTFVISVSSMG